MRLDGRALSHAHDSTDVPACHMPSHAMWLGGAYMSRIFFLLFGGVLSCLVLLPSSFLPHGTMHACAAGCVDISIVALNHTIHLGFGRSCKPHKKRPRASQ